VLQVGYTPQGGKGGAVFPIRVAWKRPTAADRGECAASLRVSYGGGRRYGRFGVPRIHLGGLGSPTEKGRRLAVCW